MTARTGGLIAALPAGHSLPGFEIESVLGRGGFGITYLAWDRSLRRKVAIKEFFPRRLELHRQRQGRVGGSPEAEESLRAGIASFLNEARLLARFEHPNIVRVHSVFEANATAYMVMERIRGRDLEDAWKFNRDRSEASLRRIATGAAEGLLRLHEEGFVHRDISPTNVLVRADGTPALLDFGTSRWAPAQRLRPLATFISDGYSPWEQYPRHAGHAAQGPWSDLYSLGATLHRAVTGHRPIDARTRRAAVAAGADCLVPAVEAGRDRYSEALLSAIDWALELEPQRRPQSVGEWRQSLSRPPRKPAAAAPSRARAGAGAAGPALRLVGNLAVANHVDCADAVTQTGVYA